MGVHCNQYDAVHNNGTAPIRHSALSFALCNTFCDCTQIDDVSAGVKTEGWDPQLWLVTFGAAAAHNYSFKKGGAHIIDMMMAKASSDMQDRIMEVAAKASATSAAAFDQGGELFEEKAESQTSLHDIQASCLSAVSLKARGLTAAWSQMHLVELNITKEKRMDVILSQILSTLTAAFLGILVSACRLGKCDV